jgi:hypothetical protein
MLVTKTRAPGAQPEDTMPWYLTTRADPRGARLADRHYSRKTPGAAQFTPPGRCVVLLTTGGNALWVSSWPYAEYVKHEWRGAWLCSLFRNESDVLSSRLITQAVAATRWQWGEPPTLGMVTFVDTTQVRHKRDPGRCFRKAGWQPVGWTKSGLVVLQLLACDMPSASPASGTQLALFSPETETEVLTCHA